MKLPPEDRIFIFGLIVLSTLAVLIGLNVLHLDSTIYGILAGSVFGHKAASVVDGKLPDYYQSQDYNPAQPTQEDNLLRPPPETTPHCEDTP